MTRSIYNDNNNNNNNNNIIIVKFLSARLKISMCLQRMDGWDMSSLKGAEQK